VLRVYGLTPRALCQPRASEAVSTALRLDPELPEAHMARALYGFHFEPRWRDARAHFDEALARRPSAAVSHAYLGMFLATCYAGDEARRALARAVALDSQSAHVHFLVAASACALNDADLAEQHARRALDLEPESLAARWPLTVALLMADRIDEAVLAAEQVMARTRAPIYVGVLALVCGRSGRPDEARTLRAELADRQSRGEFISPTARLAAAMGLEDRAAIREALAECADGEAAPFSVVAPTRWLLDHMRDDPEIDRQLDRLLDGARPT
jgi:Tfp pilus assembly protein PilF